MRVSAFTHDFLLLFAGPIVWAVHFLVIYGIAGLVCARPAPRAAWLGLDVAAWGLVVLGIVAAAAILACWRVAPREPAADGSRALRWLSRGLALLALLAIAWETVVLFVLPFCG